MDVVIYDKNVAFRIVIYAKSSAALMEMKDCLEAALSGRREKLFKFYLFADMELLLQFSIMEREYVPYVVLVNIEGEDTLFSHSASLMEKYSPVKIFCVSESIPDGDYSASGEDGSFCGSITVCGNDGFAERFAQEMQRCDGWLGTVMQETERKKEAVRSAIQARLAAELDQAAVSSRSNTR